MRRERVDEPRSRPTIEEQLSTAFNAQEVDRFEALIKSCGKNELSLIQRFTHEAARDVLHKRFLTRLRYENMMLIGLRRIIELSSPNGELMCRNLDLDNCLDAINRFILNSNVSEILMYPNSQGFTFLYFLTNFQRNFSSHEYEKIREVHMALEEKFLGGINSNGDPAVLKAFVKSGVMPIGDSCEKLLTLFPEQKVEEVFADIPVLLSPYDISFAVFKIFFKQNKFESFKNLYRGLWYLILNVQNYGYEPTFDKLKFVVENLPGQKLECVELFRQNGLGSRIDNHELPLVVAFIVEHKLADYFGLQALCMHMHLEHPKYEKSLEYLKSVLQKMDRQTAVALMGLHKTKRSGSDAFQAIPFDVIKGIARLAVRKPSGL